MEVVVDVNNLVHLCKQIEDLTFYKEQWQSIGGAANLKSLTALADGHHGQCRRIALRLEETIATQKAEIERLREHGPGDPQVGYADQSPKTVPLKKPISWRDCKELLSGARQLLREAKPDLKYQESCNLWRDEREKFYEKVREVL